MIFLLVVVIGFSFSQLALWGSFSYDKSVKAIKSAKEDMAHSSVWTPTYTKAVNTIKAETTNIKNNASMDMHAREYVNQNSMWINSINNNSPYMGDAISRLNNNILLPPPENASTNNSFKINFNTNEAQIEQLNAQFARIQNDLNIKINAIKNNYLLSNASSNNIYSNGYVNTYPYNTYSNNNVKVMSDEEFFQKWKKENKEDLAPVYKVRDDAKKLAAKYCIDITTVEWVYETKDCRDLGKCINHCNNTTVTTTSNYNGGSSTSSNDISDLDRLVEVINTPSKTSNKWKISGDDYDDAVNWNMAFADLFNEQEKKMVFDALCIDTLVDEKNCLLNNKCIDRCSNSVIKNEIIPAKFILTSVNDWNDNSIVLYRMGMGIKNSKSNSLKESQTMVENKDLITNDDEKYSWVWIHTLIYPDLKIIKVVIIAEWSPAEKAWLLVGDEIVELDWKNVKDIVDFDTEEEAQETMKKYLWDIWTTLRVKVKRWDEYFTYDIVRWLIDKNFIEDLTYADEDFVALITYYMDNKCSINWSIYDEELNNAFKYACENGFITDFDIKEARLLEPINRMEASFVLSKYAIEILGKQLDESRTCEFVDIPNLWGSDYWPKAACQLWIMWIWIDKFNPTWTLTRAEFWTILSRMLYGDAYNQWWDLWYARHLQALKNNWIMNIIDPNIKELKWWVLLMLMRNTIK